MSDPNKPVNDENDDFRVELEVSPASSARTELHLPCPTCCSTRTETIVTLDDISKWSASGTITKVYQFLEFEDELLGEVQSVRLVMKNPRSKRGCPLFDSTNHICTVANELPEGCKAYPWGFTGKQFFRQDKMFEVMDCHGLEGTPNFPPKEDQERAMLDYQSRLYTHFATPILYGLFMKKITKDTRERTSKGDGDTQVKTKKRGKRR